MVTVKTSLQASQKFLSLRARGFPPFQLFAMQKLGLVVSWFAVLPRRFPPWLEKTFSLSCQLTVTRGF